MAASLSLSGCIPNSGRCVSSPLLSSPHVKLYSHLRDVPLSLPPLSALLTLLHSGYFCLLFTTVVLLIFEYCIRGRNSRQKRGWESKSIRRNAIRGYGGFLTLSEDLSPSFRHNLRSPAASVPRDIFRGKLLKFPSKSFVLIAPQMFHECSALCTHDVR